MRISTAAPERRIRRITLFFDFECTFCANNLVGKAWRSLGERKMLEELVTIPAPRKGKHVSTKHLVDLAMAFDQRRASSEILTLRWNPRAFLLQWLPALLRDLRVVTWILARLLGFHIEIPRAAAGSPTSVPAREERVLSAEPAPSTDRHDPVPVSWATCGPRWGAARGRERKRLPYKNSSPA